MNAINDSAISKFLKLESASGIILMAMAVLAMIIANSSGSSYYNLLLDTPVEVKIGNLEIAKPLLLWINDGLMALFFFLVGLELKRELVEGELSNPKNIVLPAIGAIGGMAFPAMIYLYFNHSDPVSAAGWAIPAATDIAFALGVLSLLGSRVPVSLKVFLTSLAIFDDIGAIVIIAIFYTSKLSLTSLMFAAACLPILYVLNRKGVDSRSPYMFIGLLMWVSMLKSGVHATLAGVLLALFIPIHPKGENQPSLLKTWEHDLHFLVAFIVLPVFAFANAGIDLRGVSSDVLFHDVPVGVALGLIIGKQVGIFGLCGLAIKLGLTAFPKGINWGTLYGVSALCGIGFTMSLFVGSLAFEETEVNLLFDERLGIIVGSLISGVIGFVTLNYALKNNEKGG
ncbi:Na+/H+ antiporter NhaA [Arenicella sp. 4NH20-0111]|uniref:Na+/H+ antiporter NhaA n=1 Tax=Arenicella sp. 4NH20-0111 TaxID=3127648 RepID=UPI00333FEE81